MALSREMRRLDAKWLTNSAWPKRLEWMELINLRGWNGHRVEFAFPIVAIVGENGSGKSTILQAAAASYRSPGRSKRMKFASDFFPDTPWDQIKDARITYSVREGATSVQDSVRKPDKRWRGNPERRERRTYYIDLSRIQPLSARAGYLRLAKATVRLGKARNFALEVVQRLSKIMGHSYDAASMASTQLDTKRLVPVVKRRGNSYSGFHQGAGELTAAELLSNEFEKYSLVIIDEIESSLHPRAQRRLIRDLAELAREKEIQFIISTHSPYVLEELPAKGRICIVETDAGKTTVTGVSPEFAMSRMDEESHPECDVYVEDDAAAALMREAIVAEERDMIGRVQIIPFGAASVGISLGLMVKQNRFPRKSVVFLDGDQDRAPGVHLLPGEDAPERVVFEALEQADWPEMPERLGRQKHQIKEAMGRAMTLSNHHDWVGSASEALFVTSTQLWQVMCAAWVKRCASTADKKALVVPVRDVLEDL
ncbi:AAA family ATPase [Siccirubricoccus sp. KC 17139]|uniref:AAA family ATPase n=1 Tax=Siccirubricoccus soli TaxID=2899147 RepID=A0ABT1CZQ7_9PROT|nr:ATP-binding protein [Siccirubricoccus soli]MCO6415129.1 AAA family ATPase [Siccirubricoccus soli]MCP2681260.1 AAA family ATPase [Siccirubricoccus soli]